MCAIVIMTARGHISIIEKSIFQGQARSPAQLARDGRRDSVFGGAHPVWHSDGCVFKVDDRWTSIGDQFDVVRWCVGLIEHVREARLQKETRQGIPVQ